MLFQKLLAAVNMILRRFPALLDWETWDLQFSIPSLIGVIYQKTWPVFITIAIMVLVIIAACIYEHKGKLK